jgi:pimeloyl-ACP methyl ester carboxylesterase
MPRRAPVHYLVEGPNGAPAVAFVHGLGASSAVWQGQASRLYDRFRVVRYDLRSHGSSRAVDQPCSRSDLATELIEVLDAATVERAFIVGHSAGGVIAMHTALEHPDRVLGLVLVGTASECNDKTAAWYEQTAATARERGGAEAVRAMGLRSRGASDPDGRGFAHLALAMRTLNSEPLTERLRGLQVPTLIIVGEKDFLGVGGSVILSRAIAGSELEIVAGRGHGIYLEDPEWFAARVTRFFERVLESSGDTGSRQ